jgi:hypothetical protein
MSVRENWLVVNESAGLCTVYNARMDNVDMKGEKQRNERKRETG